MIALAIALQAGAAQPLAIVVVNKEKRPIPGIETGGQRLTAVHFWAVWCAPCLEEIPDLDRTAGGYKDKGFRVIALSLDMDKTKVEAFFREAGIKNLSARLDSNNAAFLAAKLRGLPGTLFFNAAGELIAVADGPLDWKSKTTTDFIEQALK